MTTKSDRPLSDEIAAAIVRGFKAYYIVNVASMEIPLLDDHQSALEKLKKTGNQILILLTLREWRNWTSYTTAGLNIDAVLQVFDGQGKKLASSNIQMIDQYNSPLNASTYLTALINEPSVKAVLFPKFKPLKMEDGVEVPPDKAMED